MPRSLLTWPNLITGLRIVMVLPVIALLHAGGTPSGTPGASAYLWVAVALMLASEFSDWLDGFLARRMHWVSPSGKVLDPMADSLYRIGVFMALVANGWMPLWMLLIMAARDLAISELRLLAERHRLTLAARPVGKLRAAIQGIAQLAIVLLYAAGQGAVSPVASVLIDALLWLATAVTIWSVVDYAQSVRHILRRPAASPL